MFLREFLLRVLQTAPICVHIVVGLPFTAFMLLFALTFLLCTGFLAFDLWRSGERLVPLRDIRLPSRLKRSMVVFSFWTVAASVASVVLGSLDRMMIGALLGAEALRYVGYYAVAFNFGAVVSAPMRALSQLAIPILADAWKKKDHDAIQVIYVRSAAAQFTVGGFLFLVIWVDLSGLFTLLRPEFMAGYGAALVISATSLMNMAVGLNAGIITMSRHYRVDSITSALLLVLNVVLNWFFIRRWGIEGAAWSSFVSLAVVLIIRVAYLKKKFDLWPFTWRTLLVPVLIVGSGRHCTCCLPRVLPWSIWCSSPRSLRLCSGLWSIGRALRPTSPIAGSDSRAAGQVAPSCPKPLPPVAGCVLQVDIR